MVTIHAIRCMKPSWTRIAILHILYLEFCMICYQKSEIALILHCKIRLCFWSFFQLLLRSMHGKHNILYQTGYIHHTKPFLWWFIEFSKLAHFLAIDSFSAIPAYFQIMRREFCVFCVEPLQPTQGSWLVPLEPPKSPKRGPF